ncbi:UNVERIFIED_CONTAM: putative CDP-diacylglycerol--inositol 3-phosphatidyltransferase 2 [Sesamum calycinum]|uniref:CDP-diacylglycerol--inositol 3-phosphatidyltransferase n=1 Tax=Sesamum calycinum TaxID=2727403 RepID=A0AAW2NEM5_9LAMI
MKKITLSKTQELFFGNEVQESVARTELFAASFGSVPRLDEADDDEQDVEHCREHQKNESNAIGLVDLKHSEQNSAIPMADKSRPSTLIVYLYVPNIIGYVRILMNCFAFAICYKDKYLFSVLYFVSFVCDALDGWCARKLNQVSTFGAVLDMVTDRISTACLLVILSQVYRPGMIFLSLLALDIASHWLQMYSSFLVGKASHKDVKDSSSWLFKLYYGNRKFMGYCCVSCEVLVNAATQSWLYLTLLSLSFIGWVIKQIVNVIQVMNWSTCGLADRVLVVEPPKALKPLEHALRKKLWAALVMRSLIEDQPFVPIV